ncbi:hypothetical protein ACIQUS_23170 [Pseudomonas sp. NPDC090755]|uniref:hypothetical protein n=1 Tax=Pseudomonas sp. NPDC090755 TaxID=3364481 RepID=UPI00383A2CA7
MDAKSSPWYPPHYELADAAALKGVAAGTASPAQQQRALKWLIETACATYDMSYRPNSERDTSFAEGRRFVGLEIIKLLHIDLALLRKE